MEDQRLDVTAPDGDQLGVGGSGPFRRLRMANVGSCQPQNQQLSDVTCMFAARSEVCEFTGTRTPNLLIRRGSRGVRHVLSNAVVPGQVRCGVRRVLPDPARGAPWIAKGLPNGSSSRRGQARSKVVKASTIAVASKARFRWRPTLIWVMTPAAWRALNASLVAWVLRPMSAAAARDRHDGRARQRTDEEVGGGLRPDVLQRCSPLGLDLRDAALEAGGLDRSTSRGGREGGEPSIDPAHRFGRGRPTEISIGGEAADVLVRLPCEHE